MSDLYVQNGQQWAAQLQSANPASSGMADVWAQGHTGSYNTVVGVVDTGVNYAHEDLYLNIWLNQGELPNLAVVDIDVDGLITFFDLNSTQNAAFVTDINANGRIDAGDLLNDVRWENGVDEDGSGYVDDLIGWDFANGDNDPWDDNGHGTHVAGTIGAMGGNVVGVAGVNWSTQMAIYKMSGADGRGTTARGTASINHFTQASLLSDTSQQFVATNHSWGTTTYSSSLQYAIDAALAQGILTVASAGNSGSDVDVTPQYPSALIGVVTAAASDIAGNLAWFSSYGDMLVELAAPGQDIVSALNNGGYGYLSGTSMAAPHVAGALTLAASVFPLATTAQLVEALHETYDTASLQGRVASGGTLDLVRMFAWLEANVGGGETTPPPAGESLIGTAGSDTLDGGAGNDTLIGVPVTGSALGHGTIDVLSGGAGSDTFILGDTRGAFYDDGKATQAGMNHYARIMDFTEEDALVVTARYQHFVRAGLERNGYVGAAIYADTNLNGVRDKYDEMIAHLVNFNGQPSFVTYQDAF